MKRLERMDLEDSLREYNALCPGNKAAITMEGDALVVHPSGSFDLLSSQALLELLSHSVDAAKPGMKIAVELSQVTYLPSTAIGALSTALVKAERVDVFFSIRAVPVPIATIIKLLGFWDYFHAS
jgi:anti-anti-sigma factor